MRNRNGDEVSRIFKNTQEALNYARKHNLNIYSVVRSDYSDKLEDQWSIQFEEFCILPAMVSYNKHCGFVNNKLRIGRDD